MTGWYISNIVLFQQTLTTLLLALSIQIPMRVGVFSFAGIGAVGIGGYTAASAMIHLGWSTYPAIILGTIVPGVLTFLLGLVVQRLSGLYLGMATLAFTMIVAVVAVNGGKLTGGASGLFGAVGDIGLPQIFLIVLVVVAVVAYFELGGRGRRVDAVREDPSLAAAIGISVGRYRRVAFLTSGLVGGLAGGIMTLQRTSITPAEVNFHLIVVSLTVIVVGGFGSWVGVLIGSIVFVWLPTWLSFVSDWESIIYGFLVALAAIFLPGGIHGLLRSWVHRIRSGGRPQAVETSAIPSIRLPLRERSKSQKEGLGS